MTRQTDRGKRDADVLSRAAPDVSRPPVDETQSTRQSATAPQPKLEPEDLDDDITGEELDEAWAGLTLALKIADEEFDAADAYGRLSRSLPADLVQMPLVERASLASRGGSRTEFRNLALGLVAMGTVCAGLAGLAFFGPSFESKPRPERDVVERTIDDPPRLNGPSLGGREFWDDAQSETDLLALAHEFEAERRRLRGPGPDRRPDEALARLEHDIARTRHEFDDHASF